MSKENIYGMNAVIIKNMSAKNLDIMASIKYAKTLAVNCLDDVSSIRFPMKNKTINSDDCDDVTDYAEIYDELGEGQFIFHAKSATALSFIKMGLYHNCDEKALRMCYTAIRVLRTLFFVPSHYAHDSI